MRDLTAIDIIKKYLIYREVNFIENYKIKLKNRVIIFDFYIPHCNKCIKHFNEELKGFELKLHKDACESKNITFVPLIKDDFNRERIDEIIDDKQTNEYIFMINKIYMEGKITKIVYENESSLRFEISQQSGTNFYKYSICCFNANLFETIKSNVGNVVLCEGSFHRNDYFNKKENRFVNSYTITCDKIQRR